MFYQGKNVLVAGGTGFIGVNLIQRLLKVGARVRATLHASAPVVEDERVEYVKGDLLLREDCRRAVQGVDLIFMCAANSSGAAVIEKTPLVHLTPNIIMNVQMLEASYEASVRKFCFISSNTVYPHTEKAVCEDDTDYTYFEKYFIVGWMKRFSEVVCEIYSQHICTPMDTVIVRPGNIYGPHDKFDWRKSKVIAAIIRRAVERHNPFEVWGDGMDLKDFIYIEDFIDGLLLATEKISGAECINIASGRPVTIRQVLTAVLDAADYKDANVRYNTSKPTMIPKRIINIEKARSSLGFEARISLEEGLQKTVDWYREHPAKD